MPEHFYVSVKFRLWTTANLQKPRLRHFWQNNERDGYWLQRPFVSFTSRWHVSDKQRKKTLKGRITRLR